MLAQHGRGFHVEVIQRNDAIDVFRPRHVADAQHYIFDLPLLLHIRHVEELVDALARPFFVAQAVRGEQ
jgi:hypothetical protein